MSKKSRSTPAKFCTCNKCKLTDRSSIPGSPHRRCSGNPDSNAPRRKGDPLPGAQKGTWN